jgi:hypothetical protein
VVQVSDIAAAEGEHDVAREIVAGVCPPVGKQARARGHGAVGDDEPLSLLRISEVVAADASPDFRERVALELVLLAAVLAEHDGALALDDPSEESAGADCGKLVRIADQDCLPVSPLDQCKHGRENARLRHRSLVDDDDGPVGQATFATGVLEQPMQSHRRDAGLVLELLGGDTGRGRAEDLDAHVGKDVPDGVGRCRLTCAREANDADHAALARRDLPDHPLLLL